MNEELNEEKQAASVPETETQDAGQAEAAPAQEAEKKKEPYTASDLLNDALDLIETVICSVFMVMLLFSFVFCIAGVDGPSMEPTLFDGQRLIVSRMGRSFDNGDILIIDCPDATVMHEDGSLEAYNGLNKRIVKRLIAQGGQTVDIDFAAGTVYVDGQALDEPYTSAPTYNDNGALFYPFTVPEGYLFVLGDNRPISADSRDVSVGLVHEKSVLGKVVLRITPLSEFGTVD